jgi:hypothetical protein
MDEKLTYINQCLKSKVAQRLFYWVVGGMVFFVVVVIGGAQWQIVGSVAEIDTNVKVMSVTVNATKANLERHIDKFEDVQEDLDERVDELERSDYIHKRMEP